MKQGSSSMNVLGAIYSWMKERNMGSKVKWRSKSSKVGHKQTLHKDRLEIRPNYKCMWESFLSIFSLVHISRHDTAHPKCKHRLPQTVRFFRRMLLFLLIILKNCCDLKLHR